MYSQNNSINYKLKIWLISLYSLVALIIMIGGLTRLTDSGLSITSWEVFTGIFPPLNSTDWINYFELYKLIPEYQKQNYNMTLSEFKFIFWWEWSHRILGRIIAIVVFVPMIIFAYKSGFWILKKYSLILFLVLFQGIIGWYMVSSGLSERTDVSHYRLSMHLVLAFIILSIIFWHYLFLVSNNNNPSHLNHKIIKFFLLLLFIQLIFGAFVSGMDAGKIYNTWPLMGSSYFPNDNKFINLFNLNSFNDPSLMQFVHRNFAYLIVLFYIYLLIKVIRNNLRNYFFSFFIIGVALLGQIILGIFTVLSGAKILYSSLHQINSIFLISSVIYLLYINKLRK